MRLLFLLAGALLGLPNSGAPGLFFPPARGRLVATFSIVARDPSNGDLGVAVQSKFPNVRVAVPYAKAGVDAVATQSFSNSDFGTKGLQLLELGATPQEVLTIIGRDDADLEDRQVGIVDAKGRSATFTGKKCFNWAGGRTGENYAIQGNILVSETTATAMEKGFHKGRTDGTWDEASTAALADYMGWENHDTRIRHDGSTGRSWS
jgi:uncharacterized Ntn-hydrolase superfamily protein